MESNKLPKELEDYSKWEYMGFFLETIIPSLEFMIKEGQSYPASLSPKKWRKILSEMREGFKLARGKINYKKLTKKQEVKVDKSFDLFKKYFFHLWD